MAICPHCRNFLGGIDLESGRCSFCNGQLESAQEQVRPPVAPGRESLSPALSPAEKPNAPVAVAPSDPRLAWPAIDQRSRGTADDRNIAGTIYVPSGSTPDALIAGSMQPASGQSPPEPEPAKPAKITTAANRLSATIDLGALPQVMPLIEAPDPSKKTTDQRRVDPTIDIADLPDHVAGMWQGQIRGDASPRTSIGGKSHGLAEEPDLVIHQRAICDVKAARVVEADYELLGLLGKGGMGEVLAARQASINRSVALKKINETHSQNPESRRKFLAEAVVTGDLEHPNIVPIYDLGKDDSGLLFYVMKHVHGTPWDRVIGVKSFTENLEIYMKVADAVAFAHSRNVVHRDLKPENVMLGGFGEVLLMDWGLAIKIGTKGALSAGVGGTPAYMAPEMMTVRPEQIGFASDVYLLGAILYEVITGYPPHAGATVQECLIAVFQNKIHPTNRDDELVAIALKAMSTKTEDRYASVGELQDAIRQYQSHSQSVVLAKRAEDDLAAAANREDYDLYARALFGFQEAYELWQGNTSAHEGIGRTSLAYARRALSKENYELAGSLLDESLPEHRELLAAVRAAQSEQRARQQRLRAAKRVGFALVASIFVIVTVASLWILHEYNIATEAKAEAETNADNAEKSAEEAIRVKNAAYGAAQVADEAKSDAVEAQGAAEEARKAAEDARNVADNEKVAAQIAKTAEIYGAYVARIGLASAKIDENAFDISEALLKDSPSELRNWEWGRLKYLCSQSSGTIGVPEQIETLAISPDGARFATGGQSSDVRLWDAKTLKQLGLFKTSAERVFAVAFSPDGRLVAVGSNEKPTFIKVFDAATGKLAWQIETRKAADGVVHGHTDAVLSVAFSPDGQRLLTSSYDNTARLFDCKSHEEIQVFRGHDKWVWSARFSPDGQWIVTASQDGTAMVWDAAEGGEPLKTFRGHTSGAVYSAVFVPDGADAATTGERRPLAQLLVASGGYDKRIILWKPDEVKDFNFTRLATKDVADLDATPDATLKSGEPAVLAGHEAAVWDLSVLPHGRLLASCGNDNTIRIWDLEKHTLVETLRGHSGRVHSVAFAPSVPGSTPDLYSAGHDQQVRKWDLQSYEEIRKIDAAAAEGHRDALLGADFSPSGEYVVTASRDGTARVWNRRGDLLRTLSEGHDYLATSVAFFPDGKRFVTAAVDSTARIWDRLGGVQLLVLKRTGAAAAIAISHDGTRILTGGDSVAQPQAASGAKGAVGGAPGDATWPAKVWNAATGEMLRILSGHNAEVTAVAFSPDDRIMFTGDANGRCRLWGSNQSEPQGESPKIHTRGITAAGFVAVGAELRLVTASSDNTVRLWHVNAQNFALESRGVFGHPDAVAALAISPDGLLMATACADRVVRFWTPQSSAPIAQIMVGADQRPHFYAAQAADAIRTRRDAELQDIRRQRIALQEASRGQGGNDAAKDRAKKALDERERELLGAEDLRCVSLSPDAHLASTTSSNGRIRLWDIRAGREVGAPVDLDFSGGLAWSTAFDPSGTCLAIVGGSEARLWDRSSSHVARFGPQGAVASARFSPADEASVVTASWDYTARIWDWQAGRVRLKLVGHGDHVNDAVYSRDGRYILTASDDKTALLWDAQSGRPRKKFAGHDQRVRAADLYCDAAGSVRIVVTACDDGVARVFDGAGKLLHELKRHDKSVQDKAVLAVACSPQGDRILTASEDNSAVLWNAQTGKKVLELDGHTAGVTTVAFSPDGLRALTGSRDNTVKVWELKTGKELLTLKGHAQEVTSARFSHQSDKSSIVTAGLDGNWMLWLAEPWK